MGRISLLKGSYEARSIIADAQACINLYPEKNEDSEAPITLYTTAGLDLIVAPPIAGPVRCSYRATNGDFYRVIGQYIYYVDAAWVHHQIGIIANRPGQVSMVDNSLALVIVDGSGTGYAVDLQSKSFSTISSPNFFGADRVDYVDTYFVFNYPNTNKWYISLSNSNFSMLTGVYGGILTGDLAADASHSYVPGTKVGVALTGGSGTGAIANIVVGPTGVVSSVTITTPGLNYVIGDVLGATIAGGGTGFAYTVDTVSGVAFDPLDIATKSSTGDNIVTLIVLSGEVWLIGQITSEVWYNSGAADFTFARLPGASIEHGCAALYSLARHEEMVFFVGQDREGSFEIIRGSAYKMEKISTNAIENDMLTYPTVTDAIGYCYQQEGHTYYVVNFPSANKTWVYDLNQELWHQRAFTDTNGVLNRHLGLWGVFVYSTNTVGDYTNGNLYKFNMNTYTDNGNPITRLRRFPHQMNDMKRVSHTSFVADMEVGTDDGSLDGTSSINPPQVFLSWSNNRGKTFGNPVGVSLGSGGQYAVSPKWNRLGLARDRVYQLMWSCPTKTALNGAFLEVKPGKS